LPLFSSTFALLISSLTLSAAAATTAAAAALRLLNDRLLPLNLLPLNLRPLNFLALNFRPALLLDCPLHFERTTLSLNLHLPLRIYLPLAHCFLALNFHSLLTAFELRCLLAPLLHRCRTLRGFLLSAPRLAGFLLTPLHRRRALGLLAPRFCRFLATRLHGCLCGVIFFLAGRFLRGVTGLLRFP
jgi:hypothetical protein